MPTRYLENIHPRSRFAIWAWSPTIFLRVALFAVYALYTYAAVIAFIAGIPIFALTTPEGYTSVWAIILGVSAIVAAIGAISDQWQHIERWASLVLAATMLGYVGTLNLAGFWNGDLTRQFVGAIGAIALVLPATRFVYLAAQSGKRRIKYHDLPG